MQHCGLPFSDAALVLQWHVAGMFAPGFFTGRLIRRFGPLPVMAAGLVLTLVCIAIALSGVELRQFVVALTLLGVGWNFLFTGATTLSLSSYAPQERDRAQAEARGLGITRHGMTSVRGRPENRLGEGRTPLPWPQVYFFWVGVEEDSALVATGRPAQMRMTRRDTRAAINVRRLLVNAYCGRVPSFTRNSHHWASMPSNTCCSAAWVACACHAP